MSYYIIIRGPLGCGKSTIAKRLSGIIGARCFEIDNVLHEHHLEDDHEAGYISQISFIRANEILAEQAKDMLKYGTPVVFDGNFYWISQIDDLIARLDYPHKVFTLKAPLEVCIRRDNERQNTYGIDAVRAVYEKAAGFNYGTIIDASRPIDECVGKMLHSLPHV